MLVAAGRDFDQVLAFVGVGQDLSLLPQRAKESEDEAALLQERWRRLENEKAIFSSILRMTRNDKDLKRLEVSGVLLFLGFRKNCSLRAPLIFACQVSRCWMLRGGYSQVAWHFLCGLEEWRCRADADPLGGAYVRPNFCHVQIQRNITKQTFCPSKVY